MNKYFNIFLEFDRKICFEAIGNAIIEKTKGYVCVVDGNVLATANKNKEYREIINGGLVNICDGSSIALLAGIIHRQRFSTYTGPEIFTKYIKENYKQYFLGNTEDNLQRLKNRFIELGYDVKNFKFEPLPFRNVEEFDYKTIACNINDFSPDIIWVSLGAPKQEFFINKLYKYVNVGVLFAIGATFNLFLGDESNKRAPQLMRRFHLEWLFRVFQEPKRIGKRALNYFFLLPRLILEEIKNKKYN
jgi:N-acetylglucosaminyldiphosphoundecaprenol N-acetyl-beta-D-mannosaminyltransferase